MPDRDDGPVDGAVTRLHAVPRDAVIALRGEVAKVIVGQDGVVSGLLAALLVGGHVLLEGVPGVAKTLMVKALAGALDLDFKRLQFTPDLMPSDVLGQLIYEQHDGTFRFRDGPVFTNFLLADEINRTPPKTQSALLEAMEERQVTLEGASRALPNPFLVVATQNPIEYEGPTRCPRRSSTASCSSCSSATPPPNRRSRSSPATTSASTRTTWRLRGCSGLPARAISTPPERKWRRSAWTPACRPTSSPWPAPRVHRHRSPSGFPLAVPPCSCGRPRRGPGWRAGRSSRPTR
jgi:hypothetical protein